MSSRVSRRVVRWSLTESVTMSWLTRCSSLTHTGATRTTWLLPGLSCSLSRSRRAPRLTVSTCGEAGQSRGYRVDTDACVCDASCAVFVNVQQLLVSSLSLFLRLLCSKPFDAHVSGYTNAIENLSQLRCLSTRVECALPFSPIRIISRCSFLSGLPLLLSIISALQYFLTASEPTVTTACERERDGPHHTRREIRKEDKGHKARREQRRGRR